MMNAKTNSAYPPFKASQINPEPPELEEVVFQFLETFIKEHNYSPSMREIGRACHVGRSTVVHYLDRLEAQGRISRELRTARSISITKPSV